MNNPYIKKRGDSPPPRTSFQRELDQTVRERAKRGLAADVSPQDSDDDGIEDDNELLGDFAATTKPKTMGYLRHADPLMMTMKEPFKPSAASRRISSPPLSNSKGQKLGSMGEEDEDLSEDSEDEPKKQRPSFLRSQQPKEPKHQRPKSPSMYGRKKIPSDFDEVDTAPIPRKRSGTPSAELDERKTASGRSTPRSTKSPSISRKPSEDNLSTPRSTKSPSISRKPSEDNLSKIFSADRQTPTERRKSPFNSRLSPSGDHESLGDSRKTPVNGYKSPKPHEEKRRTPVEGHKSPKLNGDNRRTSIDGYKSPKPDGRKTPVEGHKSPNPYSENRRTPVRNHKSPDLFEEGRRTPTKDRKSPGPPHPLKKKSSVLDFLEESSLAAKAGRDSSDDEELRKVAERQKKKNSSTPEFISVKIDGTIRKDESSDSKVNRRLSDNESSAFEEKLEEPVHRKEAATPAATTNKAKVKAVRIQRTGKKAADEAIEVLTDAQNGTNKMKYIDPVKNEAFKSQSTVRKRSASSSSKILKPRAVYSGSGTLSRTSGSSTEALNFDSTKDIRQVVYEVWKVQATERMKQTAKEKKEKEKELEEKKKKEKEEKVLESVTTYQAWMDTKKGFVSTKTIQAKKEEEKNREKELKRKERKKEAEELFIKWKQTQDVVLKEKYQEKLKAMKREERKKEEMKLEKKREAESAFRKWNQNKDDHLKNLKKEEMRRARERKEHEEREHQEQLRIARDQYEKWLEKKEQQEITTQRKKRFDSDEEDGRRPWRPSSMTIKPIC